MKHITRLVVFVLMAWALVGHAQETPSNRDRAEWIKRPWEMRYFLYVPNVNDWELDRRSTAEFNTKSGRRFFYWQPYFDAASSFLIPKLYKWSTDEAISVVPIEFDKEGYVITPNTTGARLRGRVTTSLYITLAEGEDGYGRTYDLGHWFLGLGDVSTHWAPALCNGDQNPNPVIVRSSLYLYGKLFKADPQSQTFGCREWAYQLYDDARPYIDVTSYVPKNDLWEHGTYIREFLGWARFGDIKPVIGKNEATWYCLYDCPNGEAPGPISDIKAWAAANGWPVPKKPTKSPTFVDPPGKQGTYP